MSLNYTATGHMISVLLSRVEAHIYKTEPYPDPAFEDIDQSNDYALECLHVTLKAAQEAMMETIHQRQAKYYGTEQDKDNGLR